MVKRRRPKKRPWTVTDGAEYIGVYMRLHPTEIDVIEALTVLGETDGTKEQLGAKAHRLLGDYLRERELEEEVAEVVAVCRRRRIEAEA